MKKKYLLLGTVLTFFAFVIFIVVVNKKYGEKNYVTNYIRKNHTNLEKYCEKIRKNTTTTTEYYDNWEVTYWSTTGMVEFIPKDKRYLQSPYKGFFYSHDDRPLGFQGLNFEFDKHDSGWIWVDDNSDNWEYTEKIIDNWYWFEMHF